MDLSEAMGKVERRKERGKTNLCETSILHVKFIYNKKLKINYTA